MTENTDFRPKRRTVLKGVGAAGLVGAAGVSPAVADKGGNDPCEGCGTLLTKYEFDEDAGEFVWEKGHDGLNINGDEFDITITEWNEDGEPLCIEVESITQMDGPKMDPDKGIYEFSCSTVKSGQETDTADYDWASGFEHCQDKYAISNFALCINDRFWQADFGTGPAPTLYTESSERDGYGEDLDGDGENERELIMAGVYGPPNRVGNPSYLNDDNIDGVNVLPGANGKKDFDLYDADGNLVSNGDMGEAVEAEVQFEITSDDPVQLHIGVWEMPGPYDKGDIPWAPLHDKVEQTYDPGDYPNGQVTERVELPQL